MTWLGKILIFIGVMISGCLAVWAFMLYTQRIDWTDAPAKGEIPAGELATRMSRIKQLQGLLTAAQVHWRNSEALLPALEKQRPLDAQWYAAQLAEVEGTGNKQVEIKEVVCQNGSPVPDPNNQQRPQMAPAKDLAGAPLLTLSYYRDQLDQTHREVLAEQVKTKQLAEEDARLTREAMDIRQQWVEERAKEHRIVDEQKDLKRRQMDNLREVHSLLERRLALESRLLQLKNVGAAARR